jgi:transcriptional regulator with XRE-family HTH domain
MTMTPKDLRSHRLSIGWSREELAALVGVSPISIQLWEEGEESIACAAVLERLFAEHHPARSLFRFARERGVQ